MRQFYGTNIDGLDTGELATLAAQLPKTSRTMAAIDPSFEWTQTDWLLWRIEHGIRVLIWQRTKDGKSGRKQPKPLMTPMERAKAVADRDPAVRRLVDEVLGINQGGES